MRHLKKRVYVLPILFVGIIGLIYCLYHRSHIDVLNNGRIYLEAGEKLSHDASEYLNLNFYLPHEKEKISQSAQILIESIEYMDEESYPAIGEYPVKVVYQDDIYECALIVQDTQPPTIQYQSDIVYKDKNFNLMKWIQVDDNSGEECQLKIIKSNLNIDKIGKYTVEVEATDSTGNIAHESLTLNVVDKTAPVISYGNQLIVVGNTFDPLKGVKAIDDLDGDCTANITVNGDVDTQKIGVYPIVYQVSDQAGNQAKIKREVVVANRSYKIKDVPMIMQNPGYYNGCESASSTMLLQYHDYEMSLSKLVKQVPTIPLQTKDGKLYGADPNEAFTGSMSREGYGIYCKPMIKVVQKVIKNQSGEEKVIDLTGVSVDELFSYIARDYPVQVWATASMNDVKYSSTKKWYVKTISGEYTNQRISFPIAEHSLLLVGYDENNVIMNDPLSGVRKYSRKAFEKAYKSMGSQAFTIVE
ncbi:C39 family peptidase [Candidatus Stoquefichus massiliensis]|uniref:C39 family peptidase n=1 Tax=Candidatus Stoquefichus massiliensis TaxID=1470350 RepID=UPI00047F77AD|nr:C39 family peptidase [Candidatus Stoquefichus massiliensis]